MQKLFVWIFFGILTLVLLCLFLTKFVAEPWIARKIQSSIHEWNPDYDLEIGQVHLSLWKSGLELENISLQTNPERKAIGDLNGEVESIRIEGIKLVNAIFKKDIEIKTITIYNSSFKGCIPFPEKAGPPKISTLTIRIDSLFFDRTNIAIRSTTNSEAISLKDGVLKVYQLQINKLDTFSTAMIPFLDFDIQELSTVSADSMYSYTATGITYASRSKILMTERFSVHPNYGESEFTDRYEFETDRFEAVIRQISFHGLSVAEYLKTENLICSYLEIGEFELNAYRDKRKEFRHIEKPMLQDLIANYPGKLDLDSIGILSGNLTYTEHAEKANEPGYIRFNEVKARIYNLTNVPILKSEDAFLKFNVEALLMGAGKLAVLIKSEIGDRQNAFSVVGSLSGMDINQLNPMLEKNEFVYVTSGKIDQLNFSFIGDRTKASGQMVLLYHGLDIAVKNKRTDDTTAVKERLLSIIGNAKLLNSNPIPGDAVRPGIINYPRDPERFFFNYCFKSIMSGIKSSISKKPKK